MKQKIIKFFEELNKAPEHVEVKISSKNYDAEHVISEAAIIAPQAANKLLEAVELLEKAYPYVLTVIDTEYTKNLAKKIEQFMEDFNND